MLAADEKGLARHPFLTLAEDKQPLGEKPLWIVNDSEIGMFAPELLQLLAKGTKYPRALARAVLNDHFSESPHLNLIAATGLSKLFTGSLITRACRGRQSQFRANVLRLRKGICAACGLNLRLNQRPAPPAGASGRGPSEWWADWAGGNRCWIAAGAGLEKVDIYNSLICK